MTYRSITTYRDVHGDVELLIDSRNPESFRLEFTYPDGSTFYRTINFNKKETE